MTHLWKYNRVTGYWVLERTCAEDTKDAWLAQFQKDEPNEFFKLARNRPSAVPKECRK